MSALGVKIRRVLFDSDLARSGTTYRSATEVGDAIDDVEAKLLALVQEDHDDRLERALEAHPRARTSDPSTSVAAAERIRPNVHNSHRTILEAYLAHADGSVRRVDGERMLYGMTAREVEERFEFRGAHKRTSELLRVGYLEVVELHAHDALGEISGDLTRDGGRVLRITDTGRAKLAQVRELEG